MRKMSTFITILFFVIFTSSAIGGGSYPDWILPELNRYPLETFIFDVGHSVGTGEEAYKRAIAEASKKISKQILRQVMGIISLNKDNDFYHTVLEHYSAALEDYCSWHHASPALQLEGLKHSNLSLKNNAPDEQGTFAVVYIERDKLKGIYADHELKLQKEIIHQLKIAKTAEDDLDINKAVKAYLRTYPLYESLKESQIIQIGAQRHPNSRNAFRQLINEATKRNGKPLPHRNVIKRVEKLENETIVNFIDICRVIDSQLSQQIVPNNDRIVVNPLIYEDSEMFSPFAQKFTEVLLQEMPEWVFVDPILELKKPHIDTDELNRDYPSLRLSSSYWTNGDGITIRTTLRNINTGEFLASSVVEFIKTNMRDRLTYTRPDYKQAQKEKEAFNPRYFVTEGPRGNADEVLIEHEFSPTGGLKIDIWTDKGRGPLYYTEGDIVTIFARVNQPAYLRLLYTLANQKPIHQKRILLVDNLYIGVENVNTDVKIGEFLCVSPFGVEFLNVAARTEAFPDIETYEKDGFFFLKDQDAKNAAKIYRGLKRIPKKQNEQQFIGPKPIIDKQPSFQQVEAQLVLTVEEK